MVEWVSPYNILLWSASFGISADNVVIIPNIYEILFPLGIFHQIRIFTKNWPHTGLTNVFILVYTLVYTSYNLDVRMCTDTIWLNGFPLYNILLWSASFGISADNVVIIPNIYEILLPLGIFHQIRIFTKNWPHKGLTNAFILVYTLAYTSYNLDVRMCTDTLWLNGFPLAIFPSEMPLLQRLLGMYLWYQSNIFGKIYLNMVWKYSVCALKLNYN